MSEPITIDVWSDYVCPFCWIAKRHLDRALADFPGADDVTIRWHPFELDREAPAEPRGSVVDYLIEKYHMSPENAQRTHRSVAASARAVGANFTEPVPAPTTTFDAHRVGLLAADMGLGAAFDEAAKSAYFNQGKTLADHEILIQIATDVGLPGDRVRRLLDSDEYAAQVHDSETHARTTGVTVIPFFLINGTLTITGAQPPAVFLHALEQAAAATDDD